MPTRYPDPSLSSIVLGEVALPGLGTDVPDDALADPSKQFNAG